MDVALALLADRGLPGIHVAARRLVVVAEVKHRRRRQAQQLADRAKEGAHVAAGEVGPRGTEIGHEQRVADEDVATDVVADVGGRMARRIQHLDGEIADGERLAVHEQPVEIAAVGLQVGGVEDRAEDLLDLLDVLADADLRAGLRLHVGRAGEMVGVGVGLQRPDHRVARLVGGLQHRLDGAGVDAAAVVIVVEHRIDEGSLLRLGIGHDVAHRVGGLVEEGLDDGFGATGFGHCLSPVGRPWTGGVTRREAGVGRC